MPVKRLLPVFALALSALLIAAVPALGQDLSVLDATPDSPGNIVTDGAGNAYVAWTSDAGSGPDAVIFCKVPAGGSSCSTRLSLPLPPATSKNPEPSAAFPVLAPGGVLYVVAPRYVENDTAVWKSTDGGLSFGAPVAEPAGYSNKTDPTDAFYAAGNVMIGAHNSGLGFSTVSGAGGGGSNVKFERDLGAGGVAGSSLGVDGTNPVTAYWNISSPPYPLLFLAYDGSGPLSEESNWVGPTKITDGYEPRLAGGPSGLFLASQDYAPGGQYPTVLDVRKYGVGSFGAPITLANDPEIGLFNGGSIDQSASGSQVAVVWPGERPGDRSKVMRLYLSGNGGASFGGEVDIGHVGTAYAIGDNAEVAVANGGNGWGTFIDATGLHLLDFAPIAGPAPGPAVKPPDYKGKTKVADTKNVGGYSLILRLPKQCVQSQQRFFAGVGARKRKALAKKLGGKVKLKQVVFVYDGKKLKVKKKKPFRYLIDPGPMAAESTHVVKAKVTVILTKKGSSKKVKRTLKGAIKSC